jgi:hypothetical protein
MNFIGSAFQPVGLIDQLLQNQTEFLIGQLLVDAGAGITNGREIIPVRQDAGMERPLTAPPGTPLMHHAAPIFIVENTVAVYDLHLDDIAGYPPILFSNSVQVHAKVVNHPLPIVLVQRHRGLTLTAIAAPGTNKYIRE